MTESIALAIAVPAALGAAWLASRRSWSPAVADNRGIALQTVIVIVVMLVIAGAVAGVLISRGNEVLDDLEATLVINGPGSCAAAADDQDWINTATWSDDDQTCTLVATNAGQNQLDDQCNRLRGNWDGTDTCVVG